MASPQEAQSPASSIASNDSSIFEEPSFDYHHDAQGNLLRTHKRKVARINTSSSPPTPNDSPLSARDSFPPQKIMMGSPSESDLVSLNSPNRRLSLTRSESAQSALSAAQADRDLERDSALQNARSFQRVASGPAIVVSNTAGPSYQSTANSIPKRLFPRRTADDILDQRQKRITDDHRARLMSSEREQQLIYPDEKENMARGQSYVPSVEEIYGTGSEIRSSTSNVAVSRIVPPLRPSHQQIGVVGLRDAARMRQLPPSNGRPNRLVKAPAVKHNFDKISELHSAEGRGSTPGEDTDPGTLSISCSLATLTLCRRG